MSEHRPQSARDVLKALGLESSAHTKIENIDEESMVRTQTSPVGKLQPLRDSSVQQTAAATLPADESGEEYDDASAQTVVPRHSRAADDPALASTIPLLRPSGTFPPKPPEAPAPATPQTSAVITPTPASPQPARDQGQRKLVIILAVLLAAAVGVILYFWYRDRDFAVRRGGSYFPPATRSWVRTSSDKAALL
jgi:hypothetical protein